jgi:hypothetical protein
VGQLVFRRSGSVASRRAALVVMVAGMGLITASATVGSLPVALLGA